MRGNSLTAQWLGVDASGAKGLGSIPGWGTNIPQATQQEKNKTLKETMHILKLQFHTQGIS